MGTFEDDNKRYVEGIRQNLEDIYNGKSVNEDGEKISFYDYFSDVLGWTYSVDQDFSYKGVRAMVTSGGPNIYIDTIAKEVQLYWGTDVKKAWLSSEICDEINNVFEEFYNEGLESARPQRRNYSGYSSSLSSSQDLEEDDIERE